MEMEIKELEEEKKAIESETDLYNYLNHAIEFNYYTGAYWSHVYNKNNELEEIIDGFNFSDEYIYYLAFYADSNGDIFFNYPIIDNLEKDKINYLIEYMDFLTYEQFQDVYIIEKMEFITEIFEIPEQLEYYIDYGMLERDITINAHIDSLNNDYFIILE